MTIKPEKNLKYYRKCSNNFAANCMRDPQFLMYIHGYTNKTNLCLKIFSETMWTKMTPMLLFYASFFNNCWFSLYFSNYYSTKKWNQSFKKKIEQNFFFLVCIWWKLFPEFLSGSKRIAVRSCYVQRISLSL